MSKQLHITRNKGSDWEPDKITDGEEQPTTSCMDDPEFVCYYLEVDEDTKGARTLDEILADFNNRTLT